uniref:Transposable element Tc1 transposase n=1 Tax=Zeugodacus cucurbitae TaxID=28588 RepID=A0A0A1XKX3_ZEUCU
MRGVSEEIKRKVERYFSAGKSARDIGKELKISHTTVLRIGKNSNLERLTCNKGGRPKKIQIREARHVGRLLISNKLTTPKQGLPLLTQNVSVWTLRRALKDAGYKAKEKKKKPALTKKKCFSRKDFLARHEYWTCDDWKRVIVNVNYLWAVFSFFLNFFKVIWSDETKINRFQSDGRSWYWSNNSGPLQPHQVKQTIKFGGGCLMMWGCITQYGVGPIVKIDGKMKKEQYWDILKTNLPIAMDMVRLRENRIIFQQDNDPKHSSKLVQNWLKSQSFSTMRWPAQSPDMNPIENLWSYLKRQLANYPNPPKGMQELWERVEDEWYSISPDFVQKLYESMPRRLNSLKKVKGLWTDY